MRRMAFEMYLEGMGFRAIGRVLRISYGTVFYWIKKCGSNLEFPVRNETLEVLELDKLHSYVGKKTTDGYGLLLIDLESVLFLLSVETVLVRQDYNYGTKYKTLASIILPRII